METAGNWILTDLIEEKKEDALVPAILHLPLHYQPVQLYLVGPIILSIIHTTADSAVTL